MRNAAARAAGDFLPSRSAGDDVGDRFEACAGRAADQRCLMWQVERVRVEGERRVGDDRGDIVGTAGTKRHRNQLLSAFFLIGAGG